MSKPKFVLKAPNGSVPTPILLCYTFSKGQRLKISAELNILPAQWAGKPSYRAKTKGYPQNADINARLGEVEAAASKAYRRLTDRGAAITPLTLKAEYEQVLAGTAPDTQTGEKSTMGLVDFATEHIKCTGSSRAEGTLQVYNSTLRLLQAFDKYSRRITMLTGVTLYWYTEFTLWLSKTGIDKPLAPNTVGKVVKTVKAFLRAAYERDLAVSDHYKRSSFKVHSEPIDSIYLTLPEVQALISLDLPVNSCLAHVRDTWVLGCMTGLRFSDLKLLTTKHIFQAEGQLMLRVQAQKTGVEVVIPWLPEAAAVLARNGGSPPPTYSNAGTNKALKELGKQAGLIADVYVTVGESKVWRPKYELLTMHTARRTFATLMYLAGVAEADIMQLTGHKKARTLQDLYIRASAEQRAKKIAQNDKFSAAFAQPIAATPIAPPAMKVA